MSQEYCAGGKEVVWKEMLKVDPRWKLIAEGDMIGTSGRCGANSIKLHVTSAEERGNHCL